MIKWTKNEKLLIASVIILIFITPILIHICYRLEVQEGFFKSKWGCGDILQYCGAIITSFVATAGVYISLKENRKNNLENKILEYRPYLKSSIINLYKLTELENIKDNNNLVWVWSENSTNLYNLSNVYGKQEINDLNYKIDMQDDFITLVYDIDNIGLGHALKFNLTISGRNIFDKQIICKSEKKRLYILISKNLIGNNGMYLDFDLEYKDIIDVNIYSQKEKIFINGDKSKKESIFNVSSVDGLSEPLIIEKKIFK